MYHAGLPAEPPDWYAALGLPATATGDQISAAVERMSRQATALSVTAPERSRLLRDQVRAIKQDLLSGDAQRQRYDQQRAQAQAARGGGRPAAPAAWPAPGGQRPAQAGAGLMARVAKFLQTGWTCATCGYGALPNDRFCAKCGSTIEAPAIAQQRPGGFAPAKQAQQVQQAPQLPASDPGPSGFCGKCGGSIAPGNAFCTQCGAGRA